MCYSQRWMDFILMGKRSKIDEDSKKRGAQQRQVVLEYYVLVGEPGEYYQGHISTKSGKTVLLRKE